MGKYVEHNLARGEKVVRKAKLTLLFVVMHLTNLLIIPLLVRIVIFKNIELAVTDKRVIGKTGVFNTRVFDSPVHMVQNCAVTQDIWGKLFNYGTILITTAAGSCSFRGVKDPDEFKNVVMEQIERYSDERLRRQADEMAKAMSDVLKK